MAHESNQGKMQLGCSPYGNGYQGLISKGSRPGSQAAGRPVHFNPVLKNRFLGKESFKVEGLQVVKSLIQQGDVMMKLELKDAYYTLPIHPSNRK